MISLENVLIKPLITEKATLISEKANRYGFMVALKANKNHIRGAIEKFYNVRVIDVKTSVMPGKLKRVGKSIKKSSKRKKAFVQLAEGQKIEFFKGV